VNNRSTFFCVISWALMGSLLWTSIPAADLIAGVGQQSAKPTASPLPAPVVKVNRTVPKVNPVPEFPVFSAAPKDEEFMRARVFEEPLAPMGGATNEEENQALASALLEYLKAGNTENLSKVEGF
jgi:hypothetical protein